MLQSKFALGLFDAPLVPNASSAAAALNTPAHRALALRAATEGIVLLKNRRATLPLPADLRGRRLAVVGENGGCPASGCRFRGSRPRFRGRGRGYV